MNKTARPNFSNKGEPMLRTLSVLALLSFPTASLAQMCAGGPKPAVCEGLCGCFRWAAKTGGDAPDLASVTLQSVNIGMLGTIPVPNEFRSAAACNSYFDQRVAPTEKTVFQLQNVAISAFAFEADSDFHVVLTDQRGRTIVSEIPDPNCIVESAAADVRDAIRQTRARFLCRFPGADQLKRGKFRTLAKPTKSR